MKKIPMRMCVACREMRAKRDLMRIVRTAEGELRLDLTGKLNGRGAYLCPDPACLKKAVRAKALEHAFSAPISPEVYERLHEEMEAGE